MAGGEVDFATIRLPCYTSPMSRSPETPKEPDWYGLALQEASHIHDFRGREVEVAHEASSVASGATITKDARFPYKTTYHLRYGSKELLLRYYPNVQYAETYLKRISDEKIENETTILYMAAKIIMRKLSELAKTAIEYRFETANTHLNAWANKRGNELFNWQGPNQKYHKYKAIITSSGR